MNKCRNPEHPHCTVWVMPGDAVCAHGHQQPRQAGAGHDRPSSSFDLISTLRRRKHPRPGQSYPSRHSRCRVPTCGRTCT
jgi:hypothetical protein